VDIEWYKQRKDTTWDYFRSECSKVVESKVYEAGSIIFLCVYAIFVLIALSLSTLINNDEVLDIIDQSFLCVFILEILL